MIANTGKGAKIASVLLLVTTIILVTYACTGQDHQPSTAETVSQATHTPSSTRFSTDTQGVTPSAATAASREAATETAVPTHASRSTPTSTPTPTAPTTTPTPTYSVTPTATQEPAVATKTPTQTATPSPTPGVTSSPQGPQVQSDLDNAEWPQLAHDPQRSGYVPIQVPTPWRFKWVWNGPVGGGDAGPAPDHLRLPKGVQPVVGDGKLYVGHSDGIVRAISEATGQEVWASQPLNGAIINTGAYDRASNSVYFGAQNGKFHQLDAATGNSKRVVDLRGPVDMAPLLAGDTVYIGSRTGILYALDRTSMVQRWSYDAGAELIASPAYSARYEGLIIILAEDKSVHAVQASNGSRRWRVLVNGDGDPLRGNTVFADTYPVVSDANDVVIVRSYMHWDRMWVGPFATIPETRDFLAANPTHQSFFVLSLDNGASRFIAPVLPGSNGNGGDFESVGPQVVLQRLPNGTELAYLLWRNQQACVIDSCDPREDTTLGEMDLQSGAIRFVQSYKNEGPMRLPTDEQSPLSMAGGTLFYAHWMTMGAVRITDRSDGLGDSYANPIRTEELMPVLNTLVQGSCPDRDAANHRCPQTMNTPYDAYQTDPGFYVYYYDEPIWGDLWVTPVRSVVISSGSIYWRTDDGSIFALRAPVDPTSSSKTAHPPASDAGETVNFAIEIAGTGASTSMTDQLPADLTYLSSITTCPGTLAYDGGGRQVTYSGVSPANAYCTVEIASRVATSERRVVVNTANIDNGAVPSYDVSTFVVLNGFSAYLPSIR